MGKLFGWLCLIGGLLWGANPVYDWLVLDRRINTGYIATDPTDYVKFVFPLLCIGGAWLLSRLYNRVKKASMILVISLILNGLFHFFEIYSVGSNIPFGLLFLFTGTLTLLIGSILLFLQLLKETGIPRLLYFLIGALALDTLLFCLLPFISILTPDSSETLLMVGVMMLIGLLWSGIGAFLIREQTSSSTKSFTRNL